MPLGGGESLDASAFEAFDNLVADGALADGRPRFVHLCVGRLAGQAGSEWTRRVEVPLGDIGWTEIGALARGARLIERIAGRGRDGAPACASGPVFPPG